MKIGVPTEVKNHEYRVGLVPASVRELAEAGHDLIVQSQAGAGIGYDDEQYKNAGATIATDADAVFSQAELIVKVKEPQPEEYERLQSGQVLFTYLHLAADLKQTEGLMKSGATAIAYETVTSDDHTLPLLTPMSEVAGRMSVQVGAHCLQKAVGGRGVLLGGVPGVAPGKVVILGGGVAGSNAAEMAMGMKAHVVVIDRSLPRLRELSALYGNQLKTVYSTTEAIEREVTSADLVIGSVLLPGAAAPKLVTMKMVTAMRNGSAMVDISIDQGGCFETSRPTSHDDPIFEVDGVVHYCVTNMPGAVAHTSTYALNNATLPFVKALANKGWKQALADDPHLANGLNIHAGTLTQKPVADALGLEYTQYRAA